MEDSIHSKENPMQPEYERGSYDLPSDLRTIVDNMDLSKSYIIVGSEGSGKSLICSAIHEKLLSEHKQPCYIDINKLLVSIETGDDSVIYLLLGIKEDILKADYVIIENIKAIYGLSIEPSGLAFALFLEKFVSQTKKPLLITNRETVENLLLEVPVLAEISQCSFVVLPEEKTTTIKG